jgi:hypothetical protein
MLVISILRARFVLFFHMKSEHLFVSVRSVDRIYETIWAYLFVMII